MIWKHFRIRIWLSYPHKSYPTPSKEQGEKVGMHRLITAWSLAQGSRDILWRLKSFFANIASINSFFRAIGVSFLFQRKLCCKQIDSCLDINAYSLLIFSLCSLHYYQYTVIFCLHGTTTCDNIFWELELCVTQLTVENCRKGGGQGGKKRKPLWFSHACPLTAADKRKTTGFSYRSVLQGGQAAVSRCLWPKAWHLSICSNKRAKDKGLHPLQTTWHMDMHSHAKNLHRLNSFPGSQ